MENVPAIMSVAQLLQPPATPSAPSSTTSTAPEKPPTTTTVDALRLIELTDRTSALMRSNAVDEIIHRDPLLHVFRSFGRILGVKVEGRLAVAQFDLYHEKVGDACRETGAELVLLSWTAPLGGGGGLLADAAEITRTTDRTPANPLEALFRSSAAPSPAVLGRGFGQSQTNFIRRLFATSPSDVGLFIDSEQSGSGTKVHLVVPFFGGPDDRLALELAVQLCEREDTSATVWKVVKEDGENGGAVTPALSGSASASGSGEKEDIEKEDPGRIQNTMQSLNLPDTIYPTVTTQVRVASDTLDNICWAKYAPRSDPPAEHSHNLTSHSGITHSTAVQSALGGMTFPTLTSSTPLRDLVQKITALTQSGTRVVIIAGRGKRLAVESHEDEMGRFLGAGEGANSGLGAEMRKTLGDVTTAFVASGVGAGVLVLQAAMAGEMSA